jgi:putative redox protein
MSLDVTLSFPGGKRVDARMGQWDIPTDQAQDSGGQGTAPEPFQYFLASIATCAGIYLLGFCQARKIPTENIALRMRSEWNEKAKRVERIVFEVDLPPDFPEKYKESVIRVINLCTVKKHILNPPEFEVELGVA